MEMAKWQTENSIKSVYCTEFHQAFRSISKRKKGKKRILQIDFNIWINLSENKMHSQSKVFISLDPKSVFFVR